MTLDELLLNVKDVSFETVVCQTSIQTEEDKAQYAAKGYVIPFAEAEFREECDSIDPSRIYYSPSVSFRSFYYNPETLAICNFNVEMLQLDRDMVRRMAAAIPEAEEAAQNGDFTRAIMCLPDRMRLEYFQLLHASDRLRHMKEPFRLFMDTYRGSDYGFRGMDEETMQALCQCRTEQDIAETQKALTDLPEVIVLYRGGNSESADYRSAYSWTTDLNTAMFFASRRGPGKGYIAKAKLSKADVIEAFLGERDNGEHEVIVDPQKLHVVEVIPVHGKSFLTKMYQAVNPMCEAYMQEARELGYPKNSTDHDLSHIERVLYLTQILARMRNLSKRERNILAKAAIYHDIGRTNDADDPLHGQRSAQIYRERESEPDRAVELLCQYHSVPDQTGYYDFCKELYEDPQWRHRKATMILLYQIFKDADALDRVRFGLYDLDVHQLRLPQSTELTAIARMLCQTIRSKRSPL